MARERIGSTAMSKYFDELAFQSFMAGDYAAEDRWKELSVGAWHGTLQESMARSAEESGWDDEDDYAHP